ncbi:unnamed protein product [Caenorhabditis auriculariae]|uniref:Uncharacterized protein n=1 Tax=Caenorhabditis auriculariae TaxID=2777116 RepID=A0A8S1GRH1_9PELO|nr:unnamed protein product [Caenorhabditis auriculariae]
MCGTRSVRGFWREFNSSVIDYVKSLFSKTVLIFVRTTLQDTVQLQMCLPHDSDTVFRRKCTCLERRGGPPFLLSDFLRALPPIGISNRVKMPLDPLSYLTDMNQTIYVESEDEGEEDENDNLGSLFDDVGQTEAIVKLSSPSQNEDEHQPQSSLQSQHALRPQSEPGYVMVEPERSENSKILRTEDDGKLDYDWVEIEEETMTVFKKSNGTTLLINPLEPEPAGTQKIVFLSPEKPEPICRSYRTVYVKRNKTVVVMDKEIVTDYVEHSEKFFEQEKRAYFQNFWREWEDRVAACPKRLTCCFLPWHPARDAILMASEQVLEEVENFMYDVIVFVEEYVGCQYDENHVDYMGSLIRRDTLRQFYHEFAQALHNMLFYRNSLGQRTDRAEAAQVGQPNNVQGGQGVANVAQQDQDDDAELPDIIILMASDEEWEIYLQNIRNNLFNLISQIENVLGRVFDPVHVEILRSFVERDTLPEFFIQLRIALSNIAQFGNSLEEEPEHREEEMHPDLPIDEDDESGSREDQSDAGNEEPPAGDNFILRFYSYMYYQ